MFNSIKVLFLTLVLCCSLAFAQAPAQILSNGQIPVNLAGNVAVGTATLGLASFATQILTGTPTGAASYTTPTATQLCTLFPFLAQNGAFGWSYDWYVVNTSGGSNTITMVAGSGVTLVGTGTAAQNFTRHFKVQFVNCQGTPTVNLISLETSAF